MRSVILFAHLSLCRPIMCTHIPLSLTAPSYCTCVLILINYLFDLFLTHKQTTHLINQISSQIHLNQIQIKRSESNTPLAMVKGKKGFWYYDCAKGRATMVVECSQRKWRIKLVKSCLLDGFLVAVLEKNKWLLAVVCELLVRAYWSSGGKLI